MKAIVMAGIAASMLAAGCASAPAQPVPATPKGYVVAEIEVTNPEAYADYRARVAPIVEAAGGRYLARGGRTEGREGAPPAGRMVILEYPSVEAAQAFLDSPAYRAIVHLRTENSVSRLMIVEGLVP